MMKSRFFCLLFCPHTRCHHVPSMGAHVRGRQEQSLCEWVHEQSCRVSDNLVRYRPRCIGKCMDCTEQHTNNSLCMHCSCGWSWPDAPKQVCRGASHRIVLLQNNVHYMLTVLEVDFVLAGSNIFHPGIGWWKRRNGSVDLLLSLVLWILQDGLGGSPLESVPVCSSLLEQAVLLQL
jgi:hypothetical protein